MSAPASASPQSTPFPNLNGVTTAAREARAVNELPPSPETLSIMPKAAEIARSLGIKWNTELSPEPVEEAPEVEEELPGVEDGLEEETTTAEEGTEIVEEAAPEVPAEPVAAETPEISEFKSKLEEAERKLAEREAELNDLRTEAPKVEPTRDNPLGHISNETELETTIAEARKAKDWCLRHPHGGEVAGKDGPLDLDAEAVGNILANAEAQLDAAPERKQWFQARRHSEDLGKELAPRFYEKGTPEYNALQASLEQFPASFRAHRPDFNLIILQAIVGSTYLASLKAEAAKPKASVVNGKPTVSAKPVPAAPNGRIAPQATKKAVAALQAQKSLNSGGRMTERALDAAIAERLGF